MKFYNLKCEVPGGLGKETVYNKETIPWTISYLHVIFEGWLGGNLLAVSSELIVTETLLQKLDFNYSGIKDYESFKMESSDNFNLLQPGIILPHFKRLIVGNNAFQDDIAITYYNNLYNQLIISENIKTKLNDFDLGNYSIEIATLDNPPK